jgi:hypothetical protein
VPKDGGAMVFFSKYSLPAGISKITPHLPYISATKIKCLFLIAAPPHFSEKKKLMSESPKTWV